MYLLGHTTAEFTIRVKVFPRKHFGTPQKAKNALWKRASRNVLHGKR
jgi:hypothetical protein